MKRTRESILNSIADCSKEDILRVIEVLPDFDFQRLAFAFFLSRQIANNERVNVRRISMIVGIHRSVGDRQLQYIIRRAKMCAKANTDSTATQKP
jgi:hypothetical protein